MLLQEKVNFVKSIMAKIARAPASMTDATGSCTMNIYLLSEFSAFDYKTLMKKL